MSKRKERSLCCHAPVAVTSSMKGDNIAFNYFCTNCMKDCVLYIKPKEVKK